MRNYLRFSALIFIFLACMFVSRLNAETGLDIADPSQITISMDLQNANLKDILKVFSIQSGLNFIASEGVQDRTMTLFMDKVPLQEAMDKLFKANNLAYDLDQDAKIFIVKDLGKPTIDTITKVFFLKHASVSTSSIKEEMASAMAPSTVTVGQSSGSGSSSSSGGGTAESGKWKADDEAGITSAIKKLLTENGSLMEDFRTNSIIVTDTSMRMQMIAQVIEALDVPVSQVMIEVEMLDVNKNVVDKMGINWPDTLLKLDMTGTSKEISMFGKKGIMPRDRTMSFDGTTDGGFTLGPWAGNKFGPTIFSVVNAQLTFDFVKQQTDTKTLARPRVLTLNNEVAEIKITTSEVVGEKITTEGTGDSSSRTVEAERFDTGISLRITPQINEEKNEVTMFIVPSVAEASLSPIVSSENIQYFNPETRTSKTMVKIKDGETIIVGGLIHNKSTSVERKIPILGDIPMVGRFFKHTSKDPGKQRELLVFITPHIIRDTPVKLAQSKKMVLPQREQNVVSGFDRQAAISASLTSFEKRQR